MESWNREDRGDDASRKFVITNGGRIGIGAYSEGGSCTVPKVELLLYGGHDVAFRRQAYQS